MLLGGPLFYSCLNAPSAISVHCHKLAYLTYLNENALAGVSS